jgi:MSHA pilin protein MshC
MSARLTDGAHSLLPSPPKRRRAAPGWRGNRPTGFTLVELIGVLILVGILAALAVPKLSGMAGVSADGWRDQTVAGLRLAQATAVGHRRLVCAEFNAGRLQLRIASSNPATACDSSLSGPDGADFGSDAGPNVAVAPAGIVYFQPSGRVSSDAAGSSTASRSISATGVADITVYGESGHVE